METEEIREQVGRRLRETLGPDSYELIGRSATEAVARLATGEIVSAWWEQRERHGRRAVVPRFALRVPGAERAGVYDYAGRRGLDDPERCPLVSIFVVAQPMVMTADEHGALKDVAGYRLVEVKQLVDARLAADNSVRSSPPSLVDGRE